VSLFDASYLLSIRDKNLAGGTKDKEWRRGGG